MILPSSSPGAVATNAALTASASTPSEPPSSTKAIDCQSRSNVRGACCSCERGGGKRGRRSEQKHQSMAEDFRCGAEAVVVHARAIDRRPPKRNFSLLSSRIFGPKAAVAFFYFFFLFVGKRRREGRQRAMNEGRTHLARHFAILIRHGARHDVDAWTATTARTGALVVFAWCGSDDCAFALLGQDHICEKRETGGVGVRCGKS